MVPQPLPPGEPGEIIDIEELELGDDYIGYRVLYYSRSLRGDDIAVSGFVATPAGEPPPGGWPLIAYAHGTTGQADICAPSHEAEAEILANGPYLEGFAVAATDYEGLGTPGLHPYIVGRSEARGVLDSVRAAHNLGSMLGADGMPRISVADEFVVWGHSQGGHAAMHAGQHWADYAPELQLLGVAAGAPPSQFSLLYEVLLGGPFQGYLAMASAAFAEAYDEIELDQVYTDEAIALMDVLETGCTGEVFEVFNPLSKEDLLKVESPLGVSPWDRVIIENDVSGAPVPVPLLILHGSDDEQIPALSSQILLGQLCVQPGQGPTIRIEYAGQFGALGIHDDHLDLGPRPPHRAGESPPVLGTGERAAALARGVVLPDAVTPPVQHPLLGLGRAGGPCMDHVAQRGRVVAPPHLLGELQEAVEHRRHHVGLRDPVALDELERPSSAPAVHEHDGVAEVQRHVDPLASAVVVHGTGAEVHVAVVGLHAEQRQQQRRERGRLVGVPVREGPAHALGPPGRARGVGHHTPGGQTLGTDRRLAGRQLLERPEPFDGPDHSSVIAAQRDDLLGWISDRFAGEPPPNTCA